MSERKKTAAGLLILFLVLLGGWNLIINYYAGYFLKKHSGAPGYKFLVSVIPDRVTAVGFEAGVFKCRFLTIDFFIQNLLKKRYDRAVNGIVLDGFSIELEKSSGKKKTTSSVGVPYINYVKMKNGRFEYFDREQNASFVVSGIKGKSVFEKAGGRENHKMLLKGSGLVYGSAGSAVSIDLHIYPYYTNKFDLNVYGNEIDLRPFEPLLRKNNIIIEQGALNLAVTVTGDKRKIELKNIAHFRGLKIREDASLDPKALLGVSVEQLVNFLKNSDGDFYVNFSIETDDKKLGQLFEMYADEFLRIIKQRVSFGVMTAPVRQVTDLLWNLTGENIFRIFRLFGGEENKE